MSVTRLIFKVAMGLLMLDSLLEMALISSMVAWLHRRAGRSFEIQYHDSSFSLHGKPLHLLVDQGHTSNGAAGTAFVIVGLGGLLVQALHRRSESRATRALYRFWLCMTALSVLLTLAALVYTFLLTYRHWHQTIDIALASTLNNKPYPDFKAYPEKSWTPENWIHAVLLLPPRNSSDVSEITVWLQIVRSWRWNIVPMFVLGIIVCICALSGAALPQNGHNKSRLRRQAQDKRMSA